MLKLRKELAAATGKKKNSKTIVNAMDNNNNNRSRTEPPDTPNKSPLKKHHSHENNENGTESDQEMVDSDVATAVAEDTTIGTPKKLDFNSCDSDSGSPECLSGNAQDQLNVSSIDIKIGTPTPIEKTRWNLLSVDDKSVNSHAPHSVGAEPGTKAEEIHAASRQIFSLMRQDTDASPNVMTLTEWEIGFVSFFSSSCTNEETTIKMQDHVRRLAASDPATVFASLLEKGILPSSEMTTAWGASVNVPG